MPSYEVGRMWKEASSIGHSLDCSQKFTADTMSPSMRTAGHPGHEFNINSLYKNRYGVHDGRSRFDSRHRQEVFSTVTKPVLGPNQSPIRCVPEALFSGVKRPRRDSDHSLTCNQCRAQERWTYTSTAQMSS
jgi:hypothetical protein